MHDIDQVALEESSTAPSFEQEDENFLEFYNEYEDEEETEEEDEDEEIGETAELELAEQFLEITSEQELEHFIADVVRSAAQGRSDFTRTREGRQIGGILKQAAGRVLPAVGRPADLPDPHPRPEPQGGNSLSAVAKRCFGLELEGISPEDQEFEVARRFVRFARDAIRNCLRRAGTGPAGQVTRQATTAAARRWAPGLLTEQVLDAAPLPRRTAAPTVRGTPRTPRPGATAAPPSCPSCGAGPLTARGGRWERRGNAIVLFTR